MKQGAQVNSNKILAKGVEVMTMKRRRLEGLFAIGGIGAALFTVFAMAPASGGERAIYEFRGGNDGVSPLGPLVADVSGNLYGTTGGGGGGPCQSGCGTIFRISPRGKETVLHAFEAGGDGGYPAAGLVADAAGNLYGTTTSYGAYNYGTIFKVTPNGMESVLYSFEGGSDGWEPRGLTVDNGGNIYGTTAWGGNYNGSECEVEGCGTVFELLPNGNKITVYTFQGGNDGAVPLSGVILDGGGNLLGTTSEGGLTCSVGCGTVFKIAPDGTETGLYAFQGGNDGGAPYAGVIMDRAGDLYGTTAEGGTDGYGTVYEISANGSEQVLHAFQGGTDGDTPYAGLVMDNSGNLYGTTYFGGDGCKYAGCGTVFKLTRAGAENVLYAFHPRHGKLPATGLLMGAQGKLYGTATEGGIHHHGLVFSIGK